MKRGVEAMLLLAILVAGTLLRWAYLGELSARPDFRHPAVDAGYNDYWARALTTGDWTPRSITYDPDIPNNPFFRPPGFPYFLAAIYRFVSDDYRAPRIVQMLLGLLGVWFVYRLGTRLFNTATGLIAAGWMSFYWAFIYFEGELLDTALLVLLSLVGLWALVNQAQSGRARWGFVAGLAWGAGSVVRPTLLPMLPVACVWLWWVRRKQGPGRPLFRGLLSLALGAVLVVAPVAVRNFMRSGEWVLISTNGGVNLYIGNNPDADGTFVGVPAMPGIPFGTSDVYPVLVKALEQTWGRPVTESEVSRYFSQKAWSYMRGHPARTLALMWKKTLLFWGPTEVGHNKILHYERAYSPLLSHLPGGFSLVLTMAGAGLFLLAAARAGPCSAVRDPNGIALLLLFVLLQYVLLLPFFITGQYRVPVIPCLILFGAYGIQAAMRLAKARSRRALLWAVAVVLVFGVVSKNWAGYAPDRAQWWFVTGRAYDLNGQPNLAVAAYEAALEDNPNYPDALVNVGVLYAQSGRLENAESAFRRALALEPSAPAHANLGRILKMRGLRAEAREAYEAALRVNPLYEIAYNNLAVLSGEERQYTEAETYSRKALQIRPDWPEALINLADSLRYQGRYAEAEACYDRLEKLYPERAALLQPLRARLRQGSSAQQDVTP